MKKNKNIVKIAAISAGVVAVGAGAYYLLGPKSKAHQKKIKDVASKIKNEVSDKLKDIKDITVPIYNETVDAISETYSKEYKDHSKEIGAFADKLKSDWKNTKQTIKPKIKEIKKIIKE